MHRRSTSGVRHPRAAATPPTRRVPGVPAARSPGGVSGVGLDLSHAFRCRRGRAPSGASRSGSEPGVRLSARDGRASGGSPDASDRAQESAVPVPAVSGVSTRRHTPQARVGRAVARPAPRRARRGVARSRVAAPAAHRVGAAALNRHAHAGAGDVGADRRGADLGRAAPPARGGRGGTRSAARRRGPGADRRHCGEDGGLGSASAPHRAAPGGYLAQAVRSHHAVPRRGCPGRPGAGATLGSDRGRGRLLRSIASGA
jgi:hypothetical protein